PYRSLDVPPLRRTIYWLLAIIGGGAIGILIDFAIRKRIRGFWRAVLGVAILMTPPVTLFVWTLNAELLGQKVGPRGLLTLGCQVFVIAFLVMAVRALLWRRAIETRTVVMPPLPEAERAFRM